jgi:DNA-binding GntR family transcriptional regulator
MAKPTQPRPTIASSTGQGPLARRTVAELAADALRERIVHGDYPEGMALRQDALAAELGVSRIPIREALRQLEVEGLVTFSPHTGAVVSSLSVGEIGELFDLRALIETELMRQAVPHMTEKDLDRAGEILEEYEEAFNRGDVAQWGVLNWHFHATLLSPASRPLWLGVVQNIHNQSDRYMRAQLKLTHGEWRAREEHRAILAAAREGDVEKACEQLRQHVENAGRSLMNFLAKER